MDSLLPFSPSKIPVILSRLVCHCFPLLPRPLNSLNNSCLNDASSTKAWAFHLEGHLKFQQAFFLPTSFCLRVQFAIPNPVKLQASVR